VGYKYDLAFLCDAKGIRWYGPAHYRLGYDGTAFAEYHFNYFDSEIRDGLRKGAPDNVNAASNRPDTVSAIGRISS